MEWWYRQGVLDTTMANTYLPEDQGVSTKKVMTLATLWKYMRNMVHVEKMKARHSSKKE